MRAKMAATFLGLRNFLRFLLLTMCFSSSVATVFHPNVFCVSDNQLTPTNERALMFHSSSTYHYLEQTWLYVFAVALERFNHLYGYREKSWTTLFPARCPSLCCEFWLYACSKLLSTIPIGLVNVVARKVYAREELFVIRAQNYRWSNNSLYYRLKSLGIFKYCGRRSGFSSKLWLQTNNQAIPAIFHGVVGMICVPHITFDKHLVLLDWPGSLAIIWSPLKVKLRFLKYLLLNQLRPGSMSTRFSFRMSCHWHRKLTKWTVLLLMQMSIWFAQRKLGFKVIFPTL